VLGRRPRFADLFRHYLAFAAVALDRVFLLKDRVELFDSEISGEDILHDVTRGGQGCFLLGAHLGSFEILRALGTSRHLRIGVVMYEENARKVNTVAKAINPALADDVISLGRFDSMLRLQERLQQSQRVGMLGDRALDTEARVRVPFLGEDASFPTAPFRLALMLKRPVVLMVGLYRGGNRYEIHFEKLFEPQGVERANRAHALEQAVRLYAQRLEHYCRQAPYNWFNFYDFWDGSRAPA
jgi:predicted LPLAT superfamily acyltransferase